MRSKSLRELQVERPSAITGSHDSNLLLGASSLALVLQLLEFPSARTAYTRPRRIAVGD